MMALGLERAATCTACQTSYLPNLFSLWPYGRLRNEGGQQYVLLNLVVCFGDVSESRGMFRCMLQGKFKRYASKLLSHQTPPQHKNRTTCFPHSHLLSCCRWRKCLNRTLIFASPEPKQLLHVSALRLSWLLRKSSERYGSRRLTPFKRVH